MFKISNKRSVVNNSVSAVLGQLVSIVVNFACRKVFLDILGVELLGINSTFSSIIQFMSLFSGSVVSAVVFHLYAPLNCGDNETINKLLNVYRYLFNILGVVVLVTTLVMLPFSSYFLSGVDITWEVYLYFLLLGINSSLSLWLVYKRAIFTADRKLYVCRYIDALSIIVFGMLRICAVILLKSYLTYLLLTIAQTVISNGLVHHVCTKEYPYIKKERMDILVLREIWPDIKDLLVGCIAAFIFNSTDSILISKFISTAVVGIYGNYSLIISSMSSLFAQVCVVIVPIFGNIIAKEKGGSEEVRKQLALYNFVVYILLVILIVPEVVLIQSFIANVFGTKYVLRILLVMLMTLEQYIYIVSDPCSAYIMGCGEFKYSKMADMVSAILNIMLSIALIKPFGLAGVITGTLVGRLAGWIIKMIAVYIFLLKDRSLFIKYIFNHLYQIIIFIFTMLLSSYVYSFISIDYFIVRFLVGGVVCILIGSGAIILFFGRKKEYQILMNQGMVYLKKILKSFEKLY